MSFQTGIAVAVALASWSASAAILDFKPVGIVVQPQDQLLIKGFDGNINLTVGKAPQLSVKVKQETPDNATGSVRQTLDEWNFSLQRGTSGIELVIQGPIAKDVWRQLTQGGGAPKFHLEITTPAMPLELAWRNGKVQIENWNSSLKMALQDGSVVINGGTGDVKAIGQDLEIRIKNRTGRVQAESYSGKIALDSIKGNLDVENFSGETVVSQGEGVIDFKTFKSPLVVKGGRGRIEFQTARGPIKIDGFSGDLKGVTDEAAVNAELSSVNEVRVTSQSGPIALELPNSAASVSVSSVEGGISGPAYLKSDQLVGQRVMRGRLRGSVEGSVVVRTQTGAVRIH